MIIMDRCTITIYSLLIPNTGLDDHLRISELIATVI